jgi:hypothetical protein
LRAAAFVRQAPSWRRGSETVLVAAGSVCAPSGAGGAARLLIRSADIRMATKFARFLSDNGIDPRRILAASRAIERLRPEDRQVRLERKRARSDDAPTAVDGKGQKPRPKPRSGRPVTPRLLRDAAEGKPISGPAKTRLLRSINRILEQKKQDPTTLRALF